MSFDITDAILSLRPNSEWNLRGDEYEGLVWKSSNKETKPTEAEIDAEIVKLRAEYDAQAYSRNRQAEYPSIQECVHAILDDDLDALQAKRANIKTKYPKG